MKLAHLILVHTYTNQLDRLLDRIDDPGADIYLHVDIKSGMSDFRHLSRNPRLQFIHNRTDIRWGTYSMVEATLKSFREILATGNCYTHINLLSGQDYPLKSAGEIQCFFKANANKTYMHSLHIPGEWSEAIDRIKTFNFGDYQFPGHYILQHAVRFLGIRRRMPEGIEPYGRSQWLTITPACARYVIDYLEENPKIKRFFRMSFAPDEFVFQTILMNSPFRHLLVNDNLRYIDFSNGGYHPKTLNTADALLLINSGKLYARKFDPVLSSQVMEFIDSRIKQNGRLLRQISETT